MHTADELLSSQKLHCALGFFAGILAHHGAFIHGEWHLRAPHIFLSHAAFICILFTAKWFYSESELGYTISAIATIFHCYLLSLITSIVSYRVLFHRLTRAGFKGPWYAPISKLWHVWAARNGKNYLLLARLHSQYGDFVRTGPAEVTVFHPDVFMAIDGPRTECRKAEWYDLLYPKMSLETTRDKQLHTSRRRQWKSGFTNQALPHHNEKVLGYVDKLDKCIEDDAKSSVPTKINDVFAWFSYDAMGDFVLSSSFGMLEKREWHSVLSGLMRGLFLLGPFSPTPWLLQIGLRLAPSIGVVKDWNNMVNWCESEMRARVERGCTKDVGLDLTHYLMERTEGAEDENLLRWLDGDSLLAIVVGSEPIVGSLLCTFLQLARHPRHAEILRDELSGVNVRDHKALSRLVHLNAVINESARLSPTVLTGGARKTGEKGVTIGGTFIPPHTTIVAPRYSIGRREDCFERAEEFIPERWSSQPEMTHNAAASTPFGSGQNSCVGRALALDTLRSVIATLVKKYHFYLAPGEDGRRVHAEMIDHFTTHFGDLNLCFELRD